MKELNETLIRIKKLMHINEARFKANEDDIVKYLKLNLIEFNKVSWLGEGEYGNAYSLGNGKVLKMTSSIREYEIASEIIGKKLPGIVRFYFAKEVGSRLFALIMDELETDSSIADDMYRTELILTTQGLSIEEIGNFDEREYDGSEGDLDPGIVKYMDELDTIFRSCRNLGMRIPDINYGNLGYDNNGVLTAFDIHDKSR